jgi:hypothetical protein
MEEKDGKITKLELVEVKEKMGKMRKAVPTLPIAIAIILCLLNVVLPSVGKRVRTAIDSIIPATYPFSSLCFGRRKHIA